MHFVQDDTALMLTPVGSVHELCSLTSFLTSKLLSQFSTFNYFCLHFSTISTLYSTLYILHYTFFTIFAVRKEMGEMQIFLHKILTFDYKNKHLFYIIMHYELRLMIFLYLCIKI